MSTGADGSSSSSVGADSESDSRRQQKEHMNSNLPELSVPLYLEWVSEIAEGMAFMHEKSVIHRDLK